MYCRVSSLRRFLVPKLTSASVSSDPAFSTKLHPHQQSALRKLMECERELIEPESLWLHNAEESVWRHRIANTVERKKKPTEAYSALLADDVRCLSAICK